jgi:hypothetical protein
MNDAYTEKLYHVYAKDKCIYHNLSEKEFSQIWDTLDKFLSISGVMKKDDISYEEVILNRQVAIYSSY